MLASVPTSHRNVFKYICAFLRKLLQHSTNNKLDAKNLGMMICYSALSLVMALCLCLSVTSRCSVKTSGRNGLFLAWWRRLPSILLCVVRNSCIYRIKRISHWIFVPNSENFAVPGASIVSVCCQLGSAKLGAQCEQLDRRRRSVYSTCDGRRLVCHTDRQRLSTARFRRAGSSATAVNLFTSTTSRLLRISVFVSLC